LEDPYRRRPTARYYRIEPQDVGLGHAESLTSVLVRLAGEHGVSPRDLMRDLMRCKPALSHLNYDRFFQRYAATINGHGRYAASITDALARATGVPSMRLVTLLPWHSLWPAQGQDLLATQRRWCSHCWHSQLNARKVPFDLLVWSFGLLTHCPWHGQLLMCQCPSCHRSQPAVPRVPSLFHCDYCSAPLAGPRPEAASAANSPLPAGDTAWLLADFVACAPRVPPVDLAERWRTTLDRAIAVHTRGNRAEFCRQIGWPAFALKNLFAKRERPSLRQLVHVLEALGRTPSDVFAERACTPSKASNRLTTPALPKAAPRRPAAAARSTSSDRSLVPPLWVLAQDLGTSRAGLQRKYPELYAQASLARRAVRTAERHELDRVRRAYVRRAVDVLSIGNKPPTRKKLENYLRQAGLTLRAGGLDQVAAARIAQHFAAPVGADITP
jgi:hypothetical protein